MQVVQSDSTELSKITGNEVPSRIQIDKLQTEMALLPIDTSFETEHYFSGGLYGRKITLPAGMLMIGKVHKTDHLFICAEGEMLVWTENGMRNIRAGDVVESKAGTKRVGLALKKTIGVAVLITDKTDLAEVEEELVEDDDTSPFGVGNELKAWALALQTNKIKDN
jgi:quercetin dioxygenase-like cupin family protein